MFDCMAHSLGVARIYDRGCGLSIANTNQFLLDRHVDLQLYNVTVDLHSVHTLQCYCMDVLFKCIYNDILHKVHE